MRILDYLGGSMELSNRSVNEARSFIDDYERKGVKLDIRSKSIVVLAFQWRRERSMLHLILEFLGLADTGDEPPIRVKDGK